MRNNQIGVPRKTMVRLKALLIILVAFAIVLSGAIAGMYFQYYCLNSQEEQRPTEQPIEFSEEEDAAPRKTEIDIVPDVVPDAVTQLSDPDAAASHDPMNSGEIPVVLQEKSAPDAVPQQPDPDIAVPDAPINSAEISEVPEEKPVAESETVSINVEDRTKREMCSMIDLCFLALWVLLGIDICGIIVVAVLIMVKRKEMNTRLDTNACDPIGKTEEYLYGNTAIRVSQIHNVGKRSYQEDSIGYTMLSNGAFAVVADGMGGLSGGDRVSQKIVQTMLGYSKSLNPNDMDGVLENMVRSVNAEVNQMLGSSGIYKSGSTLLSVLIHNNRFHWITVGDSRIYLYRKGQIIKLNREHTVGNEALMKAIRCEISYEEARETTKKNRVTSFIGMGELKYVDRSIVSIPIEFGDRILLMTDGVFNALSEQLMISVLSQINDVERVAREIERIIVQLAIPTQDNFSAVILGF